MSALFAGAPDLDTYWRNILAKVDSIREGSPEWAQYSFDPESDEADRIYTRKGGFIHGLTEFEPTEFGIMPASIDGGDPDGFLALRLARDALRDAGYIEREFNREKTGVILGRGNYMNRGHTNLVQHGLVVDQTLDLLKTLHPDLDEATLRALRAQLKASLPPFSAEMITGLVPNVVTGRIANRLNLMGPNYLVDAACASTLIAIEQAIQELESGRCDMMITGGVHTSTPPQVYMIFCQIDALSRGDLRPFDRNAQGTLLGEGLGLLVLKRLADAERDGDRIYAVIRGVGSSSDGKALGLLAPRLEGEVLALQRAYAHAGVDPASVELVEAHGTGIALGDRTEVEALTRVFGARRGETPRCAIGSVKSMIGHCLPAAGAAGVIKSALALYHQVLPPTICEEVNPELGLERTPFYVNTETRPWAHGGPGPRRAGVNSFGFGGVNAHVVLEEYEGTPVPLTRTHGRPWPQELVLFAADDAAGLQAQVHETLRRLERRPDARLADIAWTLAGRARGEHRLAVVAADTADLVHKLQAARQRLADGGAGRAPRGVYHADPGARSGGRTAFLFPGEGAQYPNMLAGLCQHLPAVRRWFDFLDRTFQDGGEYARSTVIFPPPTGLSAQQRRHLEQRLNDMDVASEAVLTASLALHELLTECNVTADAMLGHSTGENTALIAAGVVRLPDRGALGREMRRLHALYRAIEDDARVPRGMLLTIGAAPPEVIGELIERCRGEVHIAMDNCPNQVVVYGAPETLQAQIEWLKGTGAICTPLPFDRAYHTPEFEPIAREFERFYQDIDMGPARVTLYSATTTGPYPGEPAVIRRLAARQWASRVRFRETIERMYDDGVRTFVEVGPAGNLGAFVRDILRGRDVRVLAANTRRRGDLEQFLGVLGELFVQGVDVQLAPLFAEREARALDWGEGDAPPAGKRPAMVLDLYMPVIRLDGDRLPDGVTPPAAPPVPQAPAAPRPVPAAPEAVPSGAGDGRAAALRAHFELMNEFLEQQARVFDWVQRAIEPKAPVAGAPPAAAQAPLLGTVVRAGADELVAERRLTLTHDVFLRDHTLGSAPSAHTPELTALPVLPFTFSMEMIAEAAVRLAGPGLRVAAMSRMRAYQWLGLDRGAADLRVHAVRERDPADPDATVVHGRIYRVPEDGQGEPVLVFEGRVHLAPALPPAPAAELADPPSARPARLADDQLYTTGMFHGPSLQGVRHLDAWSEAGMTADLEVLPVAPLFAGNAPGAFELDAGLLDAAGQLVGYWLIEQHGARLNCFPFEVERFEQYRHPLPAGARVRCVSRIRMVDEQRIDAEFELTGEDGVPVARLRGWHDRYFAIPDALVAFRLDPRAASLSEPWDGVGDAVIVRRMPAFPEHFFTESWGIWGRVVAHLALTADERARWYEMKARDARKIDWLLGRIAAKDAVRQWVRERLAIELAPADIEIRTNEQGRPYAHCAAFNAIPLPDISISHSGGHVVAAAAHEVNRRVGIDLETLESGRSRAFLRDAFSDEERALVRDAGDGEDALLRIWCAKEAAAKAVGTGLQGSPAKWPVRGTAGGLDEVEVGYEGRRLYCRTIREPDAVLAICEIPAGE